MKIPQPDVVKIPQPDVNKIPQPDTNKPPVIATDTKIIPPPVIWFPKRKEIIPTGKEASPNVPAAVGYGYKVSPTVEQCGKSYRLHIKRKIYIL